MEPTEETDDAVERRYNELCLDLNMDKGTKEEAWESYQKITTKYTLEGDQMHWLACALYEACRKSVTPTVGRGTMEGNGVSLTRLLRSAKFSLIQFFNKMKKWSDMAGLPQEFIDKVNKLERNFAVSTVIFKKFEPIFSDIFQHPTDNHQNKQNRNKKQRRMPCTSNEVFNFCWTMFIQVKGHFPAISDDLVNSYHLLLCCLDWFYANALMGGRKDLLNPSFEGLPEDFGNRDWKPPMESPCLIKYLCDEHEGLEIEAKVIKEHWWKPHIKKLFDKKILKGKPDTLSAVLEVGNFDANKKSINEAYEDYPLNYSSKSMNNEYEAYVLSVGDFDERVFLGSEADEEIGTPTKYHEGTGELAERLQMKANLQQHIDETNSLAPSTPLTGRRYLKDKDPSTTPVSTATQSVSKLQTLLVGRKALPSDDLLDILSEIGTDPKTRIMERVTEMGEIFCTHYVKETDDHAGSQIDFAKKRLQLGECLYYKLLESILFNEKKRNDTKEGKAALATLMEQDIFHRTLFACCLEIVIFSYNSQRSFPWIVEIFNLSPYHFYKVIEIIIRTEEGFSRDVVKHLNHIEESILESLAWRSESPLWDAIKESSVPGCEDVVLPNEQDVMKTSVKHPAVIRVTETQPQQQQQQQQRKDVLMSPPAGVSAADRFSSPSPGSAKRRLFSVLTQPTETPVSSAENSSTECSTCSSSTKTTQIIAFQQAQTNDGRQILIPVHTIIHSGAKDDKKETTKARPKKTGSLALFFRKLYHLASVRLRDLCEQLYIDDVDLRKKMWTCFEYVLVNHVELMMDRHIDQIIMCAIYVMAKVCDHSQSFTDIMRCYRLQPQAESHVYRSVLLKCRMRRKSGGSDSSKNDTSGQSSPVTVENVEKKRSEKLSSMRSTSTLPTPHPGSHPPTPTILVHSATGSEEGEERGDLIMFYNRVFVEKVKKFAQKFSAQKNSKDIPPLSPLPVVKCQSASPRRVSSKHSIYLSPHKPTLHATPMATGLSYSFQKSPAKDLRAINNMIKMKDFREGKKLLGKRQLDVHMEEEDGPQTKQLCTGFSFLKRLQNVSSERQEASILNLDYTTK